MALAAHMTTTARLTTTTVETVRFERPRRISFRLLRGRRFVAARQLVGDRVAAPWKRADAAWIDSIAC